MKMQLPARFTRVELNDKRVGPTWAHLLAALVEKHGDDWVYMCKRKKWGLVDRSPEDLVYDEEVFHSSNLKHAVMMTWENNDFDVLVIQEGMEADRENGIPAFGERPGERFGPTAAQLEKFHAEGGNPRQNEVPARYRGKN